MSLCLRYGVEMYVDSPNIGGYVHPKWIHLPVSEAKEVAEGENYKSLTECNAALSKRIDAIRERVAGVDRVTVYTGKLVFRLKDGTQRTITR